MQILGNKSLKINYINTQNISTIQKHFFHCPQTILYLDFQCRDGVSELQ